MMSSGQAADDGRSLVSRELEFEVITVDERGEAIQHQAHRAQVFMEELTDSLGLEMIAIPAGRFLMGSRAHAGYPDECPQHSVGVRPFLLSRCPITQEQWKAVMGWLPPCRGKGPTRPVDRVSWHDAREFCERLGRRTGRAHRLPSEAEWEYACRAGTTTPFHFGATITTDLANYVGEHTYRSEPRGIYRHGTTDAGVFPPNAFGLCDMHGNVWEWCADAWHDDYAGAPADGGVWARGTDGRRVLRGGCWHDPPDLCRSAARLGGTADEREDFFGLRVALTPSEVATARVPERSSPWPGKRLKPRLR